VTVAADGTPMTPGDLGRPTWAKLVRWDEVGALVRYRVMALIVGTALLVLTAIVILQHPLGMSAAMRTPEMIVAPLHGYLYLLYLVTAADLARRAHWRIGRILAVVAAGFVPFLAFVVEHRVYRQMREEYAADLAAGPSRDDAVPAGTTDRPGPGAPSS